MKSLIACVAFAWAAGGSALAKPLVPQDFAAGYDIHLERHDPVQTVLLPIAVYHGVTRSDLGDIRVFNDASEEVPHAVRSLAIRAASSPASRQLPFFPIRGVANARLNDLTMRFERTKNGTIVDLRSRGAGVAGEVVKAYLVDASADPSALGRLQLKWAPAGKGFVAEVRVEASDDLSGWRVIKNQASLARLDYGGHSLERRTIELGRVDAKYLRLSWGSGPAPFVLREVWARLLTAAGEPVRHTNKLGAKPVTGEESTYQFDLGGPLPMDRVSFVLPQRNTLVDASLVSATSPEGPWRHRWSGLLYRIIHQGQEMTPELIAIAPGTDRFWRLRIDAKGGGLGRGMPELEAAWIPQQLLFVARGEGPFLLAFGSHKAMPSSFDASSLLQLAPEQTADALQENSVELGQPRTLGGEAARIPPAPPPSWKKFILWGLLILGVLLLGLMTVRLIRQLNRSQAIDDGG